MLATYTRRMSNNNLDMRITGDKRRSQKCDRWITCFKLIYQRIKALILILQFFGSHLTISIVQELNTQIESIVYLFVFSDHSWYNRSKKCGLISGTILFKALRDVASSGSCSKTDQSYAQVTCYVFYSWVPRHQEFRLRCANINVVWRAWFACKPEKTADIWWRSHWFPR